MQVLCHNLLLNFAIWFLRVRSKPKFGTWIKLEEQKNQIVKAVGESSHEFPKLMFDFLSTALHLPVQLFYYAQWETIVKAFYICLPLTQCQLELPILQPTTEEHKDDIWTYDHRLWHLYSHLLAKNYGWSLEYIAQLPIEEVFPKIQEIITDDQLEKEFLWGMSEKSISYDSKTQTGHFNPLPRPQWMTRSVKPLPVIKPAVIPDNLRPVGVGLTYEDVLNQIQTPYVH